MKILNITSITELRGGDNQMYTIYNLLKDDKNITQYILCPENSVLAKMCEKENIKYFTYRKNAFKIINLIFAIIKICKDCKVDILHIHDSTALNAGLIAKKFLYNSINLIFSRKRNNPIKDKFLNKYKYSHKSIKKIICVSKAVEAVFYNIIKDRDRLITIYDAIDVKKFETKEHKNILHKEFNIPQETLIIGNIASLTNQKDIYTFIDTAKKVLQKNEKMIPIKFIVIGEGSLIDNLKSYSLKNNLSNDLIFAGYRSNVLDLLPEFNIFLITSITEGLPLSIYEAMACGVPIVATKAGGIPEVVIDAKTGFLAEIKDSNTLSDCVIKLINDPSLKEKFTNNALAAVKKNHDLNTLKKNYEKLYTDTMNDSSNDNNSMLRN
ncbi:Glycosyltransferase involved in cell wall bisynthesis [Flavobacterium micromati]|jgi:glycosyltransferase involved in cell wall biosynthesis|uniref:Glycosyltransferase involved in cell wall bisynthesis n=1 Tax=Flavobacterium micromati TaxID=229205 RepID=A0A1M5PRU0_9FLAO|nr:glycosyltransferase [Flavobacterium micromati]SHH04286.1 Glycosyltransferase involved in cell wall bisynthesis [Flavobacterium micromati]